MKVSGGFPSYGHKIGILILDSKIPRIPGDLGNATSYDFPVLYKVVRGATIGRVVGEPDPALLGPFIEAARELAAQGCRAITTSCGFLAVFQRELAAAVEIPVFTSALLQVAHAHALLGPGKQVGVITAEAKKLSSKHLEGAGVAHIPIAVKGMDDSCFVRATHAADSSFDPGRMRAEMEQAARELVAEAPAVGAIVLECTNMPPYAAAVQAATGLPVFDIVSLIRYMQMTLAQTEYRGLM